MLEFLYIYIYIHNFLYKPLLNNMCNNLLSSVKVASLYVQDEGILSNLNKKLPKEPYISFKTI